MSAVEKETTTQGVKYSGTVKWFNDAKGFGFIEHESGKDVFVHYSVIEGDGFKTLKDGEQVEYELTEGDKGLHAAKVMRVNAPVKAEISLSGQVEVEQIKTASDTQEMITENTIAEFSENIEKND
jgi:CspA family cold shock protein